jgi:hypothetical protein
LISENHQDLGKIPIMDGGEKLFFDFEKISKNSFFLLRFCFACMPLLMNNVSDSEKAFLLAHEGKIITQTNNLSHPKKNMVKNDRRRAAPKNQTPARKSRERTQKKVMN